MFLFWLIASLVWLPRLSLSAGAAIHLTLASRIFQYLPDDVKDYPEYVLAGAFFPDAFYSCGNNPNASEYAHWPPYLEQAIGYYHDQYKVLDHESSDNTDKNKLKAFLYGVFTHQVTDSSWHSIRLEQGLLKMLAVMDFDQNIEDAHSFLDTGADLLHLMKLDDNSLYNAKWEFPMKDIINIFKRVGIPISEYTVRYCASTGRTALRAETAVVNSLGPLTASTSPLLDDVLESYYLGGLQEITTSIVKCLPNLEAWFQNDKPHDVWSLCGAIIEPCTKNDNEIRLMDSTYLTAFTPLSNFGASIAIGNFLNNQLAIAVGAPNEEQIGSVYVIPLGEVQSATQKGSALERPPNEFTIPYRFGDSVTHYKLLDQSFIIVTEPGSSNIYLYLGNSKLLTITDFTARRRYGASGRKQEAVSIKVHDFDGDSIPDIIISSPYNDVGARQRGSVEILSGKKISLILMNAHFGEEIDIHTVRIQQFHLPRLYSLKGGYEQFGAQAAIIGDLVFVSANGPGIVFALTLEGELKHTLFLNEIDGIPIKRQTSKESHRYGSNLLLTGTFEGKEFLIASAHRYTEGSCVGCGALYIYKVKDGDIKFLTRLTLKLVSNHSFSKFGYTAVVQNDQLFISAPGYLGHGAMFKIALDKIFHSGDDHITVQQVAFNNKDEGYTGFGEALVSNEKKLLVGSPYFGFQNDIKEVAKLTGNVIIYDI